MSSGHRSGVVLGFAVVPAIIYAMYGFQATRFGLPWWFWLVVPAAVWVTVSSAARLWRRHRLLGRLMAVLAAANMGVWWLWWHDLFAFGDTKLKYRYGLSTIFVLIFAVTAAIAGRNAARKFGEPRPADDLEPANR